MGCWDYALLSLFPAKAAYFWGRRWRLRQLAAERWGVSGLSAACRSITQTGSGRRSGRSSWKRHPTLKLSYSSL